MATKGNAKLIEGNTGADTSAGACVVLVKTEWNAEIVDALEKGCIRKLKSVKPIKIISLAVPGAVELAFAIKTYWESNKYRDDRPEAFIALGCVIKGDTPHFDYVCQSVTQGVTQLNLLLPVPTIFGVLTVHSEEQAKERLGGKHGHKGEEAGLTALKMIAFQRSLKRSR